MSGSGSGSTGFAATGIDITDFTNNNPKNSGVIANNRFIENFRVGLGYGISVSSGGRNELEIPFGSESFVFIEDNYFARNRHAVTSNFDATYVFRNNLIEDNYPNFTPVDTHGKTTPEIDLRGGTKRAEIYNNVIRDTGDANYLHQAGGVQTNNPSLGGIGLRGGEVLVYNNTISNFRFPVILYPEANSNGSDCDAIDPDSVRDPNSPFFEKLSTDVYIWNNTLTNVNGNIVTTPAFGSQNQCSPAPVGPYRLGHEYHLSSFEYTPYPYPHPLRPIDDSSVLDFLPAILSGAKD